jgi:16S rRNA A1518/A1519 N6-dimethyltransferase RsmA/KsgA/DIM1 with predicted DNA glycosylase/AP lyase activity
MRINIDVPDGISGEWEVKSFTVSEEESKFARMKAAFHGGRGSLPPGNYKKLTRNGELIMSNTPDEIDDFLDFVYEARGSVLVNGLGLGVLLKALLNKPQITEVIVIEKSQDVINLVAPTYLVDKRVKIVCADAFEYKPEKGKRFNAVWHDIWDAICSDNLQEMTILHRKYGRITDYQASWGKDMCMRQKQYNY